MKRGKLNGESHKHRVVTAMLELPKKKDELKEIFAKSTVPDISDFTGLYYIDMLTGMMSLRRLGHRKRFYTVDDRVLGHNIIWRTWGHFTVEMDVFEEDGLGALMLNYNVDENTFVTKGLRDQVRCIEPGLLYLGRANYMLRGRMLFLGYFTLSRT